MKTLLHKLKKTLLFLIVFTVSLTTASAQVASQYASSVVGFSSQVDWHPNQAWNAVQILGAPDVPSYSDHPNAWEPSTTNSAYEWINIEFPTAVHSNGCVVTENYGNGTIWKIVSVDEDGNYRLEWYKETYTGTPGTGTGGVSQTGVISHTQFGWTTTTYKVKRLEIYLNPSWVSGWNAIDAVELLGVTNPIYGCTDNTAINYNAIATIDDGTCYHVGDSFNFSSTSGTSQYVSSVSGYSSQRVNSFRENYASDVIGTPDCNVYADNNNAWCPYDDNSGTEYIHVNFSTPIYSGGCKIYENYNNGAISRIDAIDENGGQHTLFYKDDFYSTPLIGEVSPYVDYTDLYYPSVTPTEFSWDNVTTYRVSELIIWLNTSWVSGSNQIDAVMLLHETPYAGCTDPDAYENYDPVYNLNDGSCVYCDNIYNITCGGGWFQSDVTWALSNSDGATVAAGDADYNNDVCLPDGCYTVTFYVFNANNNSNGAYGNVLDISLGGVSVASATFTSGYTAEIDIAIGFCQVNGCTDSLACNYNAAANTDDGSCLTSYGCTDSTAFNYDPNATCDDGSCIAIVSGCTNSTACNYNPNANTDDNSCLLPDGCTDVTALNYDSTATCDDGSCIAIVNGCMNSTAFNYNPNANVDDGSCVAVAYGCIDSLYQEYNITANTDDGSCKTLMVTNTNDSGLGSLRGMVNHASDGDSIIFSPSISGQTITLISEIDIDNKDLKLVGNGVINTLLSGGNTNRVFDIYSSSNIELHHLTVKEGSNPSGNGGGIWLGSSELSIYYCNIEQNNGSIGGAICATTNSILNIHYSTLNNNNAIWGGGVIYADPDVAVEIKSSTLTENTAKTGGAIFMSSSYDNSLNLYNSTIFGNTSTHPTVPTSTIHSGNTSVTSIGSIIFESDQSQDIQGANFVSNGYNYTRGGSNGIANTDIYGFNPMLGPLQDNGGYTKTMLPLYNSPLINAGNSNDTILPQNQAVLVGVRDIGAAEAPIYILGCTNSIAYNYNPSANVDDTSCIIYGCTDTLACNFYSEANTDDGSCLTTYGCTDPSAFNYDSTATCDDICIPKIFGCIDSTACNYDPLANTQGIFTAACVYAESYYDCNGVCLNDIDEDGVCDENEVAGCTDNTAANYNSQATDDDGSCVAGIPGCTDSTAQNYDPNANLDNGSCFTPACIGDPGDNTIFCYGNNQTTTFNYIADNPGTPITLHVNSGATESSGDYMTFVDGPTSYDYNMNWDAGIGYHGDFSNLTFQANSGYLTVTLMSNGTNSCQDGDFEAFNWDVYCGSLIVEGCTDSTAQNYDPNANLDDGSCICGQNQVALILTDVDGYGWNNGYVVVETDTFTNAYDGYYNPMSNDTFSLCIDLSQCIDVNYYAGNSGYTHSWRVVTDNGILLASEVNSSGGFGICNSGCTDPSAINYDSTATVDDGSCIVYGCTNSSSYNYNSNATVDDGSCIIYGCTNTSAINYNFNATDDDGSCTIFGCMDIAAANYNHEATDDDGSCLYSGCTNSFAVNYNPQAQIDDGSCVIYGCTNSNATNYSPSATNDDGSCIVFGCTDPSATNYNPEATDDDGNCMIFGCTDENAANYMEEATIENGSCLYSGCTISNAINYDPNATINDNSCLFQSIDIYDPVDGDIFVNSNTIGINFNLEYFTLGSNDGHIQYFVNGVMTAYYDTLPYFVLNNLSNGTYQVVVALADSSNQLLDPTIADTVSFEVLLPVSGCTDAEATNYNADATVDDGSCEYAVCVNPSTVWVEDVVHTRARIKWDNVNADRYLIKFNGTSTTGPSTGNAVGDGLEAGTGKLKYFLDAETEYTVSMRTFCFDGTKSDWEDVVVFTTLAECNNPTVLGTDWIEAEYVGMSWEHGDNANGASKYIGQMREVGSSSWSTFASSEMLSSSNPGVDQPTAYKEKAGLTTGATYEYQVKTWCNTGDANNPTDPYYRASGFGPALGTFTTVPCLAQTENLGVSYNSTNANGASHAFSWDVNMDDVAPADRYIIQFTVAGAGNWQNRTVSGGGTATGRNIGGFTVGAEYAWRVRTYCSESPSARWRSDWVYGPNFVAGDGARLAHAPVLNLDVYPNPSRDIFNVTFASEEVQNINVKVVNMIGEEVYSEDLEEFKGVYGKSIDLTKEAKGVYFLEITTDTGGINKKMVLQ